MSAIGLCVVYDGTDSVQGELLVDIVAVHGIGADPAKSWRAGGTNWLSDKRMLPKVIPNSRILRFGYESEWLGKQAIQQRLPLVADQLLHSLKGLRKKCVHRPMVFLAHCFGGLVVEKALVSAKLHEEDYPGIITSTAGLVLLGTPHRGSNSQSKASLIATIAAGLGLGEHSSLLRAVEPDSDMLKDLVHDFTRTANLTSIPVFCFFEQHKSDVSKIVRPKGSLWPSYMETIVDEHSGCIDGFPKLGLACDHFKMNKFSDPDDGNYVYVSQELLRLVKAAPDRVTSRLKPVTTTKVNSGPDERDQACLNAIFVTDPTDDMAMIQNQKDRLLESTGAWVLSNAKFCCWLNDDLSRVLWLHGDPGKGKTMLAISLIKELSDKILISGSPSTLMLTYFFFDNKDERRKTALSFLRALIYQIICQRPDLCGYLRTEYERQEEQLLTSPNSLQTLWRVFQNIVKHSRLETLYIVVDALDECDQESVSNFLTLLEPYIDSSVSTDLYSSTEERCNIKCLLTSRNENAIAQLLSGSLDISLEANHFEVDMAVRTFIDIKVKQLRRAKHYDSKLSLFVMEHLHEKAESTFLWVALACKELAKPTVRSMNTKSVLSKLPPGITPLYGRILEQILVAEDEEMVEYAKSIIRVMAVASRPLTLQELAVAANLPSDHYYEIEILEDYVNLCGSIITVRNGTAYFVHLSAKTFILSVDNLFSPKLGEEHRTVAVNCLRYVCTHKSMVQDEEPDDEATKTSLKKDQTSPFGYPMMFWIDHARSSSDGITTVLNLEADFFGMPSQIRDEWFKFYWTKSHADWERRPENFDALHLAAYGGLFWLVLALLESNQIAKIDASDSLGNTALIWAARNGFGQVVNALLENGAQPSLTNEDGLTALYWAATNGHEEVVDLLAEKGASVFNVDKVGWNPLHRAAHHGHRGVVICLLDHGADIEAKDIGQLNALQKAVNSGQLIVVQALLERGADTEILDKEGLTLMHMAAWNGRTDLLALLLKNHANIEAEDQDGWTPLLHAAWNGHIAATRLLLQHGSNPNSKNKEGTTALHQAAWNGHSIVIRQLLTAGANANITCSKGETALQQSAWRGHKDVTQMLLENGVDPNIPNDAGHTALHQAASNGQEGTVQLLLAWGADPSIKDNDGTTALAQARENHHELTIRLLKDGAVEEEEPGPTSDEEGEEARPIGLDPAITNALSVSPSVCSIEPYGQAGFTTPSKITVRADGTTMNYFIKTGPDGQMMRGEHASLTAIYAVVPSLCPKSLAYGQLANSPHHFLLTEFLDIKDRSPGEGSGLDLAQKLAQLHRAPAPIPEGQTRPVFGFPVTTCCGSTPQNNSYRSSWAKFFAENRLRHICNQIEVIHGKNNELREWVEKTIVQVVPKLLGNGHLGGRKGIIPVVVHGDLWSGNKTIGRVGGKGGVEDFTFDASSCYAHSEYELGIMRMFGGFSAGFFNEYHRLVPKTEPKEEYDDRMDLYQLYHYLNHFALFAGGYVDDAMDIMRRLCKKSADEEEDEL